MPTANGTHTNPPRPEAQAPAPGELQTRLVEARAQRELLEEQIRVRRLEHVHRLLGAGVPLRRPPGPFEADVQESDGQTASATWGAFVDPRDAFGDVDFLRPTPSLFSRTTDRRKGRDFPYYVLWQDLGRHRQASRILCKTSSQAKGLVKNLTNYLIGTGFRFNAVAKPGLADAGPDTPGRQVPPDVQATVDACQAFVAAFCKRNRFGLHQREFYRRNVRDGETFDRLFFLDDGMTVPRFVEPEQVLDPPGARPEEGWSFGWQHQMEPCEDVVTPLQYWVAYTSDPARGELVPAAEMVHVKNPDDDSTVKRGMPVFAYDMLDAFVRASKLQRNISEGAAIQAAIAVIEQFDTATQQDVTDMRDLLKDYDRTDIQTGRSVPVQKWEPGTHLRIDKGRTYVPPPFAAGETSHLEVVQGDLRMGIAGVCAPEMFTSDASNADYSSTKEAGAPFVKSAESEQEYFKDAFLDIVTRAVRHAVAKGRLPGNTLEVVDIQAEAPAVLTKDPLAKAQRDQIQVQGGWKSRQTCAMEDGLDWDQELANIQEYADELGQPGQPLGLPPEDGQAPGADQATADNQAGAVAGNDLRTTVGGLNAVAALQADYYAGKLPHEAAVANVRLLFGFSPAEADSLFPAVAPEKLTPDDAGGEPSSLPGMEGRLLEAVILEAGFTGVITDKLGRKDHYVNGKRVKAADAGGGKGKGGGGGGGGKVKSPATEAEVHAQATQTAQGRLATFKAALGKITDVPVLKQVKAAGAFLGKQTAKFHGVLARRYGPRQATLIMASGQAIDLGLTGVGALFGKVMYVPGMSILGSLPAVAMAETYLQAKKLLGKSKDVPGKVLDQGEIQGQAQKLAGQVKAAATGYLRDNQAAIGAVLQAAAKKQGGQLSAKGKVVMSAVQRHLDKAPGLTPQHRQHYAASAQAVLARMPDKALQRFALHVDGVEWHGSPQALGEALGKDSSKVADLVARGGLVRGCYSGKRKALVLDGDAGRSADALGGARSNAHETYAHEFAHAVDGPAFEHSHGAKWQAIWQAELSDPTRLSKYSTTAPHEGWAEFGRLVYGTDVDRAKIERRFPRAAAYWREHGLWQ